MRKTTGAATAIPGRGAGGARARSVLRLIRDAENHGGGYVDPVAQRGWVEYAREYTVKRLRDEARGRGRGGGGWVGGAPGGGGSRGRAGRGKPMVMADWARRGGIPGRSRPDKT